MKAVRYHTYGGPEVLSYEEVAVPEIGKDEVLIKVAASSFNPADAMFRMGIMKEIIPLKLPLIPNTDVSGIIEKKGERVEAFNIADKVYAFLDMTKDGGAAEYVVAKAADVAPAPKKISLQDAAAIPSAATTAWQGLFDHGKLEAGQRLLVVGAAGGVGSFAIQFAKEKGAYVIGSASGKNHSQLKALGADELIDYQSESVTEKVKEKVDLILNLSPLGSEDITELLYLLKEGGTFVSTLHPANEGVAKKLRINASNMAVQRNASVLLQIGELVDAGSVTPFITERVPLSELASVHQKAGRTSGKIVILVDDSL